MQDRTIEIDSNMMELGKLKENIETGTKEAKRFKNMQDPPDMGGLRKTKWMTWLR
jgi:hypothetical protein